MDPRRRGGDDKDRKTYKAGGVFVMQTINAVQYVSTRGNAPAVGFEDVLLSGLAPDGGLYMPAEWIRPASISLGEAYAETAANILSGYCADGISESELSSLLHEAYAAFGVPAAPLREIGDNHYLLELFHGPTLAFKDFAMQVLARLMERSLARRGQRTTILGATSGDTGAAAVEAFRGKANIDLFILFPNGRISDVQRRQMTTAQEDNVHVLAVDGTFDDAQAIVKELFNRHAFAHRHALSAINSINWARIIAQAVYYFTATQSVGKPCAFSVPTGNFGDVFAGYVAERMGLPVERLIVATNENDILARALQTGRYQPHAVVPTDSPSMDIQVSSNFERLLFEASERDGALVARLMADLKRDGYFDIPPFMLTAMKAKFTAHRVTRSEAASAMASLYDRAKILIDPHTAVGLAAAQREESTTPTVVLATAHPAKFPDAVHRATGRVPDRPARLEGCMAGSERYRVVPASADAVAQILDTTVPART
jgi:threonine synthase